MPSIFEKITIFAKNLGKEDVWDVKYIFIENVYFPMNLQDIATRKLATKLEDVRIVMPNESLVDLCLYYICEKAAVPENTSALAVE